MNTPNQDRRGIALAITMLVLTVLTVISIAFFQAYQSHFSLTRSSRASETALKACDSAFQYVTYRLEHDKNWGESEFTNADNEKDPANSILSLRSLAGTHVFEGEITATGATIVGTIYNNLSGVQAETAQIPPPGTARCEVVCRTADATKRIEFLLRKAPLFDSSVLTRADLNVDANSLTLRSRDHNRNMLRSEQDIYVPDMLTGEQTKFYQDDQDSPDYNGLLWAKGEIHSYDPTGSPVKLEEEDFARATETSHGRMVSGADSHFSIFEMSKDLIEIPDSHVPITTVGAGRWTFVRRLADVNYSAPYNMVDDDQDTVVNTGDAQIWVDVLEYYADPDSTTPTEVYRAAGRTDDIAAQIPSQITQQDWDEDYGYLDSEGIVTNSLSIPGYSDVNVVSNNKLIFGEANGANLTFDLENQRVDATEDALVDVAGPFHITSDTTTGTPPPVLNLGYDQNSSVEGGVSKAVIRAEGDINIRNGVTEGLGALISEEGDVVVQPKNTNSVTVNTDLSGSGLLIFAGGNVELLNPDATENWVFKGLVYARGGVLMNGMGAGNATFEGSIVALQKNVPDVGDPNGIEFRDCEDIEFIYNSEMLDAYVTQLEGERIQVETVYWRD